MPEVVKHGETGFLVEEENEMVEMVDRLPKIERANCRARVAEHFSVDHMVDGYEQLYRKAIRGLWPNNDRQKQGDAG